MSQHDWVVIAVLDGNLKLKIEPSSDCMMYCGEIDMFVTLQARDVCKLYSYACQLLCVLFSCI